MSNTLTVRLPEDLQRRLREKSRRTGVPVGRIVRDSLESTLDDDHPAWMKYAGAISGTKDLSSRKGYSRS
ncbi:MAG: ribbon-helix-helix protein, CopG family [Acidobacteriia bacterium]|nr:ribbon-helix-helix protein, CopG family [Terriglobia bacterium]